MDFSKLNMEEVEREILVDHPIEAAAENEVVLDATENALTDLSLSGLPWNLFTFIIFCKVKTLSFLELVILSMSILLFFFEQSFG